MDTRTTHGTAAGSTNSRLNAYAPRLGTHCTGKASLFAGRVGLLECSNPGEKRNAFTGHGLVSPELLAQEQLCNLDANLVQR